MTQQERQLGEWLGEARSIVFFGGAGVSTESGIPDFRGAHGLYTGAQGRSYEEMLSIDYFERHRDEFWNFYKHVMLYPNAKPNAAHFALARLEKRGALKAVLTQNIDGLHQAAGSQNVLELHGTALRNSCLRCGHVHGLSHVLASEGSPVCEKCGGPLRPNIVFYGESLDDAVMTAAMRAVSRCDLLLVGGTSLTVYPAAGLLNYCQPGVRVALLNRDATPFDDRADLVIHDSIAQVLDAAVGES